MNAHGLRQILHRQHLASLIAFCLLSFVVVFGFVASGAHSQQNASPVYAKNERGLENTIPDHVPIKVKIKNEKSFKNLQNRGWARELELEVTNTGSKPIHYVYVILLMPDVFLEDGVPLSFRVKYGRHWLSETSDPAQPEEPPIQPGESVTIKLPESRWKAYEATRERMKKEDPKRIKIELQIIDFGDGTGYESTKGVPLTYPIRKSSRDKLPARESSGTCRPHSEIPARDPTLSFFMNGQFYPARKPFAG